MKQRLYVSRRVADFEAEWAAFGEDARVEAERLGVRLDFGSGNKETSVCDLTFKGKREDLVGLAVYCMDQGYDEVQLSPLLSSDYYWPSKPTAVEEK